MSYQITEKIQRAIVVSAFLVLCSCASGPDVRVNVDNGADFAQYKTFAFFSPLGTDRDGYQTIVSQHLKAATERELVARGMRLDAKAPQLLVNFKGARSDKVQITTMPSMSVGVMGGGYYGYRTGMYAAYPLYQDNTVVSQYTEGTLNIDVVDAARKQLVWEGIVTGVITQTDLNNPQPAIDEAVTAAFAKYPVAGPAKPK